MIVEYLAVARLSESHPPADGKSSLLGHTLPSPLVPFPSHCARHVLEEGIRVARFSWA